MHQTKVQTQNSHNVLEIEMLKLTSGWRRVIINNADVHVPRNAPIKDPSQMVAFGQVKSGDKPTAASVEDKTAGDSSGEKSNMGHIMWQHN